MLSGAAKRKKKKNEEEQKKRQRGALQKFLSGSRPTAVNLLRARPGDTARRRGGRCDGKCGARAVNISAVTERQTDGRTVHKVWHNVNPGKFVTVLQTHTKYAHLTGADYRVVLLRMLERDVTEALLIDECPTLKHDNDKPTGSGTSASPHVYYCEEPENHDTFFKELRAFLGKRIGAKQTPQVKVHDHKAEVKLSSSLLLL
ncbi:hypothetical protein DPX16_0698 [Anabarilius grahami]|uniref:Uncharacterized protein n=1 Tax=Anabarilius grahami TaxID=495550 RepID=A0A3N0XPU3_ANAGA|nr:hypothetical protein DPX16_0698 [Anabarilius grahami]